MSPLYRNGRQAKPGKSFLKFDTVHHSGDEVFSGAQNRPTNKNSTFVPRNENLRRNLDIFFFYSQYLQGKVSATIEKIHIIIQK